MTFKKLSKTEKERNKMSSCPSEKTMKKSKKLKIIKHSEKGEKEQLCFLKYYIYIKERK
jgi:hypothetical protein